MLTSQSLTGTVSKPACSSIKLRSRPCGIAVLSALYVQVFFFNLRRFEIKKKRKVMTVQILFTSTFFITLV